ncbi:MAG TPA: 4Fe-4S dicluster-binding protein [Vicinamibacteria bacterium]|nr:4Fe-4S dicluster-binding protein [Vicinamibacteria bacterium]
MQAGLLNTYHVSLSSRKGIAWALAALLSAFYILLYCGPIPQIGIHRDLLEVAARSIHLASKWRLYGILYTLAMVVGGLYFLRRHGNSRYQLIRTTSVVVAQIVFGLALPWILTIFGKQEYYFTYFWPLKIEYLYPDYIVHQPFLILFYSVLGSLVAFPLLAYFLGKRFYCSWICGCGGLANTAGDPFRHLSSKSSKAWQVERISSYAVLLLAVVTTIVVAVNWTSVGKSHPAFSAFAFKVQAFYGFWIGAVFAGVLGVGLYPLMGTRVWCRFGCPMAAILGLIQKFGRFRITVKKDMCIACGNCSTYCEMGIDVRQYAMANIDVKRAACVGCGMCAHVCPRGVLKLELKPDRFKGGTPIRVYSLDL